MNPLEDDPKTPLETLHVVPERSSFILAQYIIYTEYNVKKFENSKIFKNQVTKI